MRLISFIDGNAEPILREWEVFARSIWPDSLADPLIDPVELRDHAKDILRATVSDMRSSQTAQQQSAKSKGQGENGNSSGQVDRASELHGIGRVGSGFTLWALVAEYRALRASVLRLWRESNPRADLYDIDDVTRFNECIDQSLTEAIRSYTEQVQRDRDALLKNEQAAKNEAEAANRAKDIFLATLSHELRTPLNAIVGWVSIMRMDGLTADNLSEGLDVIERNTKAQVQLIEDVLDVSRIVSGKLRLEICDCDLIEAINAGVDVVRPAAEARDITLGVKLDDSARRASCDSARVQQIVWNLLTNAIKFTPKGGSIQVRLSREGSDLRMSVDDNGQGISPDLLPYIFDRFRQADSSNRRTYGGLGLGLSIVKHLAEMHGGTVEASSQGLGLGTTMVVRLPIKAVRLDELDSEVSVEDKTGRPSQLSGAGPLPVRLDGLRILIVDDEADARRMLVKVLESVGAEVTTASSAREALTIICAAVGQDSRPELLVSDIGMAGQSGYDLISEVRRLGHGPDEFPAVALTAYAHPDDAREAGAAGFQNHLVKPVDVCELTTVISRLAGRTA